MNRSVRDPWQALIVDEWDGLDDSGPGDPFAVLDGPDWGGSEGVTGEHEDVRGVGGAVTVVLGAVGGAGATTVACGLSLAVATRGERVTLVDLDFESGSTHEEWGIPRTRSLADLLPVIGEMRSEHLDLVAFTHDSGVDLLMAPAMRGAGAPWGADAVEALLHCATCRGAVVIDGGRCLGGAIDAACDRADHIVIVAPAQRRAVPRVRALVARYAERSPRLVISHALSDDLSVAAMAKAAGRAGRWSLPRSERDARDLCAGRWPAGRRRGLGVRMAAIAQELR